MFTPSAKKSTVSRTPRFFNQNQSQPPDSPFTPNNNNNNNFPNSIPNRPATGTPAPWAPRLSVLARFSPGNKEESQGDVIKPVYVSEFPQVVRDEQAAFLRKLLPGDGCMSGGMDKETCLCWIICGNRLFVWNYLSPSGLNRCVVLELPSNVLEGGDGGRGPNMGNNWMICVVDWNGDYGRRNKVVQNSSSAGIVMCNQKSHVVIYWPDIFSENGKSHVVSSNELKVASTPVDRKSTPNRQRQYSMPGSSSVELNSFNSMIASVVPSTQHVCVALACNSSGELWQFYCSPNGIQHSKVYQGIVSLSSEGSDSGQFVRSKGYPRSLVWCSSPYVTQEPNRQFFLLTDHEIQCFSVSFRPDLSVSRLWSHEIVGIDGDLGIKKDLAGQKRIWPLDVQVDDQGKVITVLVATFCKDRVSGSNYIQYSLLTMQTKSGVNVMSDTYERVLEKKAPIQVIIPKARVEDEVFLFSMRLRVGGKPSGSAIILSGDGTATVSHYFGNSPRLYQFDLPYDAGKVLDASILPSSDDSEDGAWVVLTEKAGIWAISEKAVIFGGVEPPERSLSRKGSSNERSGQEERRNLTLAGNIAPRRASSEAWDTSDRQRAAFTGIVRQTAQEEESAEALLGQLFNDFLLTGQVDNTFEKLKNSGAFERDGEASVFSRASKSIVDTLAKHWTTTRGAEIVAMTIVSNQLLDKQQKHERFLQFLALSKCHEELCLKQRQSLQTILEHGEKLAGMIQVRELQNTISQNRSTRAGSLYSNSEAHISGALWDLIQMVGERTRRNTVLLMDRDIAEVFYSKVSDLDEVFYCLERHLEFLVSEEQTPEVLVQRSCELSNAIVSIIRAAMSFRNEHHMWYPPPEGMAPWYCQPVVRNGLWKVASYMLHLLNEIVRLDSSAKSDLYTQLEVLAEVLLEAHSGAITAKLERGEEHKVLLDEYWKRRDSLLDSLYRHVKDFFEGRQQVLNVQTEELDKGVLRKLSSNLLSIAKRHEGYTTMWSICSDLNDPELLRILMHESMGPRGGFSYFVFTQLYEKRQFSRLLRLGEEFQEELFIFLKDHKDLLWLHELFLHQFSAASETLHLLALSEEEDVCIQQPSAITSLADRKRLLNLSKIAAMAGKYADSDTKVKRIESDLKILKLQEEIVKILPPKEGKQYEQQLLRPEELIELCLKAANSELTLRAFDVFAWTSSSFRRCHRNLLEECWKSAADLDDWEQLHQASIEEGWSDEETLQNLRNTTLFLASNMCYGPQVETFDGGFDEVLPLRKENMEVSAPKDLDFSVEAILKQHKDFPEAGKLMLTAIMLGSLHEAQADEVSTPME